MKFRRPLALPLLGFTCASCQFGAADSCEDLPRPKKGSIHSYIGSTLAKSGSLSSGTRVDCSAEESVHFEVGSIREVLSMIPGPLRPDRVLVHHHVGTEPGVPPIRGAEVHTATNAIMTSRGTTKSAAIWLHELAHVKIQGRTAPIERTTRRLFDSIHEATADYYAAATLGTPRLKSNTGETLRDIETSPRLHAGDWAALAMKPSFDAHAFGAPLTSLLWKAEPKPGTLLQDLLAALSALPDGSRLSSPRHFVRTLISRSPLRSRARLATLLRTWLPAPLLLDMKTLAQEKQ